ncbi:MAG: DNA-binding protein [Pyrobaculum sp.]|uniref:DNA-binding protein n=1 Tax=Pyrobaculum sp. TaxID=2004705 RepID=UPI003EE9D3E9
MADIRTLSRTYVDKTDLFRIKLITLRFLREQVQNAKGNLITFRPSKVAQDLHLYGRLELRAKTVLIRTFLDDLVQRGYITIIKRSARGKVYGLYKTNKLWDMLTLYEPEKVLELLEAERIQE